MNWKRYMAITALLTLGAYVQGSYNGEIRGVEKGKREERTAIVRQLEQVTSEVFLRSLKWSVSPEERKRIITLGDNLKQVTLEIQRGENRQRITAYDLATRTMGRYEE